jgi:hypothetical protein
LQAGEFVRWPSETPLLPVLTAKIVPHMFRIMLTGVLPRTPVLLIRLYLQPAIHGGR